MGAVTLAAPAASSSNKPARSVFGDRRVHFFDISPSNSYATGGDSVVFGAGVGFNLNLDYVMFERLSTDATHVYTAEYVRSSKTIKIYNALTGAEIANATDLSALIFRAMVVGK